MKGKLLNPNEKIVYAVSLLLGRLINIGKNPRQVAVARILCIKQDEIGDLCYALHVFDLLKETYPGAEITLLCKPFSRSLVQHNPALTKVVGSFSELNGRYDLIVDLRGTWQSLWYTIKHMPRYRLDRATVRYRNKKNGQHPHEVFTNLQIITPLLTNVPELPKPRIYVAAQQQQKAKSFIEKNDIRAFAVFHTSARKSLRRWPEQNFAALAQYLHHEKQLGIILTGAMEDTEPIESITRQLDFKTYNTAGIFDLAEFAALVSLASLYVGNESGPLCIAAISGTPSLGLFGPGEPIVFYPYGKRTDYLHHVLECNPCDQIHCVHPDNPCIARISVAEVITKVNALLEI